MARYGGPEYARAAVARTDPETPPPKGAKSPEAPHNSRKPGAPSGSAVELPDLTAIDERADGSVTGSTAGSRFESDASQIANPPLLPDSPKGTVLWRLRGMLRTLRPQQWVKNTFVLAPVVFAKHLLDIDTLRAAGTAFAVFCLLAGAVYTLNDLVGAPADRVHPVKRKRPIASGRVPVPLARVLFAVLLVVALGGAFLLPGSFALTAAG